GTDHHPQKGDFSKRRAQPCDLAAELATVEGACDDGASARHAAGCIWMVVGKGGTKVELQGRVLLEEIDRARTCFQEGVDTGNVEMFPRLVPQVGPRPLDAVFHSGAPGG